MRTRSLLWICVATSALLACSDAPPRSSPPASEVVLGTFVAEVDAVAGTLTIRPEVSPSDAAELAAADLVEIPVHQDGHPGTGAPDHVELVTEDVAGAVADGCAPGVRSFEGTVRVRSFYATSVLRDVHVELTWMDLTGYEVCDSAYPAPEPAISRSVGLFPYGTLTRAGTSGDSAVATWRFRYPSATSFRFRGRVLGDVVPAVPATVTATSPADGATASPGEVTVTFSAPMDPAATAAAITLTGPGGAVAGAVTASQQNQVFTFRPSVPLAAPAQYTIRVATSAGLAAPFAASFTTQVQLLSGPGGAAVVPGALAYDRHGNGLLLWGASPLWYAYYSAATGTWGEPTVLDAQGSGAVVAASTNQFAVVWNGGSALGTSVFTNGIPGLARYQASLGTSYAVASNGSGFAVVWTGTGGTYALNWEGDDWRAYANSYFPYTNVSGMAVASDGIGYRAIFAGGSFLHSETYADGTWTWDPLGPTSTAIMPALAVTPTTACIAWREPGASATTLRVERGGIVTTTAGFGTADPSYLAAAAVGDRCQVAGAGSSGVFGASYDGTAWTTTEESLGFGVGADAVAAVPIGADGFAVFARVAGATSTDVLVNRTTGWTFEDAAVPVDTGTEPARSMIATADGSGAHVAYAQADATAERAYVARVDAGGVGAPAPLPIVPAAGGASVVQIAADASGNAVAVWIQEDLGTFSAFWAYRTGGAWGAPRLLAANSGIATVASNGSEFMVVWVAPVGSRTSYQIFARRLVAGTWVAEPVLVASDWPVQVVRLATDGTGYALTYSGLVGPMGVIYQDGTWLTPRQINDVGSYLTASAAVVSGRPGEYLFSWAEWSSSSAFFRRASRDGTAWAWGPAVAITGSPYSLPAIAAGPDGFALVYPTTSSTIDARFVTGGVLGSSTTLRTGASCDAYAVASSGTTYLAATGCRSSTAPLQTHAYSGGWRSARTARANSYLRFLMAASDGTGYQLLGVGWSSGGFLYAIGVPEPVSGAFGTPVSLALSGDPVFAVLAGTPGGFLAAWDQTDPASADMRRVYARGL